MGTRGPLASLPAALTGTTIMVGRVRRLTSQRLE